MTSAGRVARFPTCMWMSRSVEQPDAAPGDTRALRDEAQDAVAACLLVLSGLVAVRRRTLLF
jgi:hypothetical protein